MEETDHELPLVDKGRFVSFSMSDLYPAWQDQAHCAGVGHDYYFGCEDEPNPKFIAQIRRASKLCDVCPVFKECLSHALTYREQYGVWAGTSRRARKRMFVRLDNGETVEELVEEVCSERRGVENPTPLGGCDSGRGSGAEQGGGGVSAEAERRVSY